MGHEAPVKPSQVTSAHRRAALIPSRTSIRGAVVRPVSRAFCGHSSLVSAISVATIGVAQCEKHGDVVMPPNGGVICLTPTGHVRGSERPIVRPPKCYAPRPLGTSKARPGDQPPTPASYPENAHPAPAIFTAEILPLLQDILLGVIAAATGLSVQAPLRLHPPRAPHPAPPPLATPHRCGGELPGQAGQGRGNVDRSIPRRAGYSRPARLRVRLSPAATKDSGNGGIDLPFAKELFEVADRMRGSVTRPSRSASSSACCSCATFRTRSSLRTTSRYRTDALAFRSRRPRKLRKKLSTIVCAPRTRRPADGMTRRSACE